MNADDYHSPEKLPGNLRSRLTHAAMGGRNADVVGTGQVVLEPERARGVFWPEGEMRREGVPHAEFIFLPSRRRWEIQGAQWCEEGGKAHIHFRLLAVPAH
ncbi:hypothetical protein TSACC_22652 [Terrimicrobium sacchariphilum]|uniref:Uncharacterized protein n=1 Tax=Terrimicrobium sacchariphilum TaxID=690879 RepID=A0A146GCE8_TERSA|nr:hypothetical protein [Terrimicrobium sacchariphilum]GAT34228.1 hypothetical protein TSACC_22652 [Terrimicrobium sacchariphilum]